MLRRFSEIIDELRGLVNENWSASSFDGKCGPKMLVAVSGGVDSMVMADLFQRSCEGEFAIAHCNFNLRGAESDGDQALVEAWAAGHGVKLHLASFETEGYASEHSVSIEMAARELRYRWFADLCRECGYAFTAVAHNANDNAETLMLNLLRGTGLDGITGMQLVSDFPFGDCASEEGISGRKTVLVRPMLGFTRKQIEGYAFSWGIKYRNDSSNLSSDYKRNRIRNEVFPQFERLNPSFIQTFNREISYFNDAASIVEDWCKEAASRVVVHEDGAMMTLPPVEGDGQDLDGVRRTLEGVKVNVEALLSFPQWRYLLYYILSPYGFNSAQLSSLENLLVSGRTFSGKTFSSATHVLQTGRGVLDVSLKGNEVYSEDIMAVRAPGIYNFNGRRFLVEVVQWQSGMPIKQPEGVVVLDAEHLKFPFVLRRWRSGDWMRPLGLNGRKLLSDMFTDLKYDAADKVGAVLLVNAQNQEEAASGRCAALLSLRIDQAYRITSSTTSVLRITSLS